MSKTYRGFTLIELLVVIAIIAIIAAIIFPVFAQVREKARRTSCASNMRQIGLAITQYSQDYDETLPSGRIFSMGALPSWVPTTGFASNAQGPIAHGDVTGFGWVGALQPYTKSLDIFQCPDDSTPFLPAFGIKGPQSPVSYALNGNLASASVASATAPSSTVLAFEVSGAYTSINVSNEDQENGSSVGVGYNVADATAHLSESYLDGNTTDHGFLQTGYLGGLPASAFALETNPVGRHTGGSNFLAADGHVKWLRPEAVSPGLAADNSSAAQNTSTGQAAGTAYAGGKNYVLTFSPL